MKVARRLILTVVVTLSAIFAGVYWIAPIALSLYAARKAPSIAKAVPTDLKDTSVSLATGTKLSYLGYEFEVPWTDLDTSKTKLYPENKVDKKMVVLTFHSGLRLRMSAAPPHEFANEFTKKDFKMSPQAFEAVFGPGAYESDYQFVKNVYEFTPARMHYWSLSQAMHFREDELLLIKSIMPARAANSGIFRIQNRSSRGFQQGNPEGQQSGVLVDLYSTDGSVDFILQRDSSKPLIITQPEINLIIQSLHKTAPQAVVVSGKS